MIEELIEGLAAILRIHGCVYQLAQVFNARVSFGGVLFLQLLNVTGAINQKLKKFGSVDRRRREICRNFPDFGGLRFHIHW